MKQIRMEKGSSIVQDKRPNYRWLLVDDQESYYTIVIQYRKYFNSWMTIKTIESEDLEYLKTCANEIIDALNMEP